MSSNIQTACVEIKTIAENTAGTPTQKLIAVLAALGVDKTADLARIIGVTERAIQKAKTNSSSANSSSEANHSSPETNSSSRTPVRLANSSSVARVEDTYFPSNLVSTVASEEVKCSEVLLRSDEPKRKKEAQGSRLDRDWQLPDGWRDWTRVTFPQTTAERVVAEADTFRDYWISAPGQKGRKADWEATWRNWCRRNLATAPLRPNAQPPPLSASAARTARMRALLHEGSPT